MPSTSLAIARRRWRHYGIDITSGQQGHTTGDLVDTSVVAIGPDGSPHGAMSRNLAHLPPGLLHLAVSVQLVDPDGLWLLQRRAASKAAFAGLWANTCCTHPGLGEDPQQAGMRRLRQEVGLVVGVLVPAGVFVYRAVDRGSGLVEHEVDHVFVAVTDTRRASIDPDEASELARLNYSEALRLVTSDQGAPWAGEVLQRSFDVLDNRKGAWADVVGDDRKPG